MRDLSGFVETRQQLLTLKPNHRMNWIGFAVSQHLNAKYVMVLDPLNLNLLLNFTHLNGMLVFLLWTIG